MSVVLDHINIVVEDLAEAQAFFVDNFGFVAKQQPTTLEGPWVDELNGYSNAKATYVPLAPADGGATHIELLTFESPASPPANDPLWAPNHLGYRHICLDVDNIQEVYENLEADWRFLSPPVTVPPPFNVTTVYFVGPGGVLIQLTQKSQS